MGGEKMDNEPNQLYCLKPFAIYLAKILPLHFFFAKSICSVQRRELHSFILILATTAEAQNEPT